MKPQTLRNEMEKNHGEFIHLDLLTEILEKVPEFESENTDIANFNNVEFIYDTNNPNKVIGVHIYYTDKNGKDVDKVIDFVGDTNYVKSALIWKYGATDYIKSMAEMQVNLRFENLARVSERLVLSYNQYHDVGLIQNVTNSYLALYCEEQIVVNANDKLPLMFMKAGDSFNDLNLDKRCGYFNICRGEKFDTDNLDDLKNNVTFNRGALEYVCDAVAEPINTDTRKGIMISIAGYSSLDSGVVFEKGEYLFIN